MNSSSTTDRLAVAIAAVAAACRVTRHVQAHQQNIVRHAKEDLSPVTVADYAAQAVVARHLADAFGELAMVGEEDAGTLRSAGQDGLREEVAAAARVAWPDAPVDAVLDAIDLGNHDASGDSYWTLDPIDGTKGFLRGGQYAVSLALIERGQVTLGVLGCPNLAESHARAFDDPDPRGTLFYATRGGGSWMVPADRPGLSARRQDASRLEDVGAMRVCESVEAAHSRLDDTGRIVEFLGARGAPARLDSQCKYAVVARGQAEAYLRLPTRRDYVEKIWDHAAGAIIAQEAGAIVTDIAGRPLDFSHGATLSANRGVVCASRAFHRRILDAMTTLGLFNDG
ncbi:MAG: 3'(2'),5'-bisphosphate nucleotidase [Gammaproteobacteria bacterium]|nr:3'(2'),5'-bisphosphate nucleotidase [Gammaproteobacteria bacterium]